LFSLDYLFDFRMSSQFSEFCVTFILKAWAYGKGGHGLPKVSLWPAIPYHSMPCMRATPETAVSGVARLQGGRPAAIFYPFGHPSPYACDIAGQQFLRLLFDRKQDVLNFSRSLRFSLFVRCFVTVLVTL
jgi:hypothetical protein